MRQIIARYAGECRECGQTIEAGQPALYERRLGIRCVTCQLADLRRERQDAADAKAAKYEDWAAKRRETATATLERNYQHYGQDWAFVTQPGHIPIRARVNAQDDRARESLEVAAKMERKANSLRAGVRVKGDAETERQARRDHTRERLTVGMTVKNGIYGVGKVVRVNRKTAAIAFTRPYGDFTTLVDLSFVGEIASQPDQAGQ